MYSKPAKGVKGFILRTMDGGYVFRVYDKGENGELFDFTDYDIFHYDLEVEILEDSAMFYDDGIRQFIDYKEE
jgi:hypothetical protein